MALSVGVRPVTILTEIQKSIFYRFNNFILNNISLSSNDLMVPFKKTILLLFYIQNAEEHLELAKNSTKRKDRGHRRIQAAWKAGLLEDKQHS